MGELRNLNRAVQSYTYPSIEFAQAVREWIDKATERVEGASKPLETAPCPNCKAQIPIPYDHVLDTERDGSVVYTCHEPASEGAKVECPNCAGERLITTTVNGVTTTSIIRPEPAPPSEMPEAVRRAIQCLRETNAGIVHSLGVDGKVAEDLERKWRTHAAPLKVAMSPDLEDLLDSIMSFADVDPDTQVKQIWRRKVAAVRAQAAGVKLPKVRGLLSKLQYGHSISAQYKKEIAAALAELDAVEGVETKEGK